MAGMKKKCLVCKAIQNIEEEGGADMISGEDLLPQSSI
jgi:hypothetical protein